MRLFVLLFLSGCTTEVTLTHKTLYCSDYPDVADAQDDHVAMVETDEGIAVVHFGVVSGCQDRFIPTVSADGKDITVTEYWQDLTSDQCQTCFAPTLLINDTPSGRWSVVWYVEDDEEPVGEVAFSVD